MIDLLPSSVAGLSLAGRALQSMRLHLGMDVAYVSRFEHNESVFQEVEAPGLEHLIAPGDRRSLDDVYCRHIVEGRLPELIPDTAAEPFAAAMPITRMVPIGAHVSVPIRRRNGELYGMFCCLSATPRPNLNARDLHVFRAFADLVADEIDRDATNDEATVVKRQRIQDAIGPARPEIALQPIVSLAGSETVGFEALARFAQGPARTPDLWFAEAAEVGLGVELEIAAIEQALLTLDRIPAPMTLSINVSPAAAIGHALARTLRDQPMHRLVLELTEHETVADYAILSKALRGYRERGAKLAIDDAGAGVSSLHHILKLAPDVIKLDMSLTRDVDTDPAKRSLAMAMLLFARGTGAVLLAEGVETEAERDTLLTLGVARGQGYLFGRPLLAGTNRPPAIGTFTPVVPGKLNGRPRDTRTAR